MITIIGAGSWGTALAAVLANNGHQICIHGRDPNVLRQLLNNNSNQRYFPDLSAGNKLFDDMSKVSISHDLDGAINSHTQYILIAVPSNVFADVIQQLHRVLQQKNLTDIPIICATKGLSSQQGSEPKWLNEVAANILGDNYPYCLLSGPSFAQEVVLRLPTAVVVSSANLSLANQVAKIFHNNWFRVYANQDIVGVQLGGALKNILAFAVGCSEGVGFGSNARAALITRGLNEMFTIGRALGACDATLMGLSGLGDLVLSATDNQSRNKRFGYYIGQGLDKAQALEKITQHVESIETTKLIYNLAVRHNLDLPITEQSYNVLYNNLSVYVAIANLAARPQKLE